MDQPDHYALLEVEPSADLDRIKAQYLLMLQAWHPDKFSNPNAKAQATARSVAYNEAFRVLSDPTRRAAYDRRRVVAEPPPERHGSTGTIYKSRSSGPRWDDPEWDDVARITTIILRAATRLLRHESRRTMLTLVLLGSFLAATVAVVSSTQGTIPQVGPIDARTGVAFVPVERDLKPSGWCLNEPSTKAPAPWQASVNLYQPTLDEARTTGLSIPYNDKYGTATGMTSLLARVTYPSGKTAQTKIPVLMESNASLGFPTSFPAAPPLERGTYTVVWEQNGAYLNCGGLVIK